MTEQTATPDTDQLGVETMRTLIGAALFELEQLLPLVGRLIDSRQRGLGFMTVEGRAVMDNLVRKEREARAWNLLHSGVKITGDVPAPGNISAYAITAEAHMVMSEQVRTMTRKLRSAGVCLVKGVPIEPTLGELIDTLRNLVAITANVGALDTISHQVDDLVTKAKRLVDGDDKKRHPKPCPHCSRDTLVIYISKGVIRCEKDPQTGEHEWCRCTDAFCPCRRNPKDHRHEWFRKPATKLEKTWWNLADAQTRAERINNEKQGADA